MLEHVEKATDYPDSDDEYSIKTDDIELLSDSDDEENEKIKQKVLKKIKEIENKNVKN
jgi:phosphatidate phosphatase PAH1